MNRKEAIEDYLRLKNRQEAILQMEIYMKMGFEYVVRDLDMDWLVFFSLKPKKYRSLEIWGYVNELDPEVLPCKVIKNVDIAEINWKNRSPMSISDFLGKNT
ncbi:DNA topoisomerase [Enterococcus italicus]|uniref:DNA topoisomerase n=1 Tax=Enterococcus italicus TaxID=246144 RepID=UPI0028B17B76|nr:DNA topoisomerase [Enterococcus italicus]